jgi:hypothetical protein
MSLPGETEAGSAGMQPCRGITWWAHRDDDRAREFQLALTQNLIGSKDPHALKIQARQSGIHSLTENAASPVQAEPRHHIFFFPNPFLLPEPVAFPSIQSDGRDILARAKQVAGPGSVGQFSRANPAGSFLASTEDLHANLRPAAPKGPLFLSPVSEKA